jgi:cytochrome c-type biogenesis protein CcmH
VSGVPDLRSPGGILRQASRPAARLLALLALLCVVVATVPARAAVDIEAPQDPELARQYRDLIAELRCPKCLNQNIAGSDAPISADLRRTVREQLEAGRTPAEIRTYLVARYGDFILYRPRLTAGTAFLWFGPGLALLLGAAWLVTVVLRRRSEVQEPDPVALAQVRERLRAAGAPVSDGDGAGERGSS